MIPVDLPENGANGNVRENCRTMRGESPMNLRSDESVGDRPHFSCARWFCLGHAHVLLRSLVLPGVAGGCKSDTFGG